MNKTVEAVIGILQRDQYFLVNQRPFDKPYAGYWEFPGGKIEANESIRDALTRELKEELGITIQAAEPWFVCPHTYPDKQVSLHVWRVTKFIGEPEGKEKQILQWVNLDELRELNILEGNHFILEKLKSPSTGRSDND